MQLVEVFGGEVLFGNQLWQKPTKVANAPTRLSHPREDLTQLLDRQMLRKQHHDRCARQVRRPKGCSDYAQAWIVECDQRLQRILPLAMRHAATKLAR
jgi:hypothetical protein